MGIIENVLCILIVIILIGFIVSYYMSTYRVYYIILYNTYIGQIVYVGEKII